MNTLTKFKLLLISIVSDNILQGLSEFIRFVMNAWNF